MTHIAWRTARLCCLGWLALFAVFFVWTPDPVLAAKCGGVNQRPCTVFERVPSCNVGGLKTFPVRARVAGNGEDV